MKYKLQSKEFVSTTETEFGTLPPARQPLLLSSCATVTSQPKSRFPRQQWRESIHGPYLQLEGPKEIHMEVSCTP